MCNCYAACGQDFGDTVGMVARARGLKPEAVKELLVQIGTKYSEDREYLGIRKGLPSSFPF